MVTVANLDARISFSVTGAGQAQGAVNGVNQALSSV
jgi:hypothetical protein